ncbi:Rho GTPase activation protein [Gilbertella persicaria]|uniref:Rho GTPase activation protein n=1 Tax=Gilbertella persicaria TaxID=101096 RepID=UPI00221F5C65|nr:Rho GTPase activation protein [Gilbertella persicaria]KAI8076434.1 Rho GTPase activation protein [Gilbertella persicaria]
MKRSNSNPTSSSLSKRRSFRGWLKRVTIPNGNGRKVDPNMPKGGVFGIPLSMSIKYAKTTVGYIDDDNIRHTKAGAIPIVVAKCGSFLKKNGLATEGIFRVSGNIKRVNALEFIFDQSTSNYGLDLNWDGYTVHDAASLLRRYLNKLPDPVIPFDYYQQFRDVMNNKTYTNNESRIEAFQKLIQSLPTPHQHLLLYMLDTLSLFASAASDTKMNIPNLAAVFCPGLLRHPDHNTPVQYKISKYVIEFLIEFQSLFTMQLLAPTHTQQKKLSTQSNNGDIPPVPMLLPSSYPKPPVGPLRVMNPSSPSTTTHSLSLTNNQSSSFIESPTDLTVEQQNPSLLVQTMKPDAKTPEENKSPVERTMTMLAPYYRLLLEKAQLTRHKLEPHVAKPTALLVCASVFMMMLCVIGYEAYLAISFSSFEPIFFFIGSTCYWNLLYKCLPVYSSTNDKAPVPSEPSPIEQDTEEEIFPETTMDAAAEEAMMNDESIMSEWRDLLTRSWKLSESDHSSGSNTTANKADDEASIMSRASRFNEEDDIVPSNSASSSSEEEDEDLGFDPETLEMYLSQYDQIKRDAELAKKLQIEEQRARDENNPFVVDTLNVSKAKNASSDSLKTVGDMTTTPTDNQKEEWKIRVFSR